jgi:hypothetical protein
MTAPVGCLDGEQAIRDALAAGPTPGPWVWAENYQGLFGAGPDNEVISYYGYEGMHLISHRSPANAGLIAACNPETMRALLAELDRLRSASRQEGWISVEERMPGPGVIVLAFFRNSYGKGRVVRAHHAPKHTIEAGHWDEDAETDNTEDGSFEPEGWYEDPAVGETLSFISLESDGAVSHWRPMPAAPQEAQGDRHGE